VDIDRNEQITASQRPLTRMPKEISLSTQPLPPGPNSPRIKQGDWAAYLEARRMANYDGADAALLINQDLVVDGDTFTPIFILENGDIAIPALDLGAVKSVTLHQILNQDRNSRVTPLQMRITLSDAYSCLSAAAVGSGMGIRRILSINGKEIGANSDVDLANILHQQHNLDRGENHD
jgi:branched-subunit amino acid aminotransferase/4-amino-4-deoxychorismate lyase